MDKEIKEYQDRNVGTVIAAKHLQVDSGHQIGLRFRDGALFVPVDDALGALLNMTTRKDLKKKIQVAIDLQSTRDLGEKA